MILTVLVISGTLLSITLVAGLIMLYQIKQATSAADSAKALFAADAGVSWWFYYNGPNYQSSLNSSTINGSFGNQASFEIVQLSDGNARVVGKAGNSKRAFLVRPTTGINFGPLRCQANRIDLAIVVDHPSSSAKVSNLKSSLINGLVHNIDFPDSQIALIEVDQSSYSTLFNLTGNETTIENNINGPPGLTLDSSYGLALDDGLGRARSILGFESVPGHNNDTNFPDAVLLIVDSFPANLTDRNNAIIAADNIRSDGGQIYVINIGMQNATWVDYYEQNIADYYYYASDFGNSSPSSLELIISDALLNC